MGFSPETLESLLLAASEGTDWNSSFGLASEDIVNKTVNGGWMIV